MSFYENFVIDCLDQFASTDSEISSWKAGNELMERLGGTAITLGAINRTTLSPIWARSSMNRDFLEQYLIENLYGCDPFIKDLGQNLLPVMARPGHRDEVRGVSSAEAMLSKRLHDFGYQFLYGMKFGGSGDKQLKMLTFCSDRGAQDFDPDDLRMIRIAAALAVANIGPPEAEGDDFLRVKEVLVALTTREREILQLYASGYRNDRIGDRLKISDVMVRKHAAAARLKLGARTRDQSIALALKYRCIDL
ncbi:MAG: hypothetical protein DHS20C03_00300 [Minwuia thermotolerans]|nr:MAG: hypothetical protein DHS20C03_00300 [Minwuia thermotolerans]